MSICCGVETSLLRAGGDQIESELAERELKKTMEMGTRRLAECVNPGSEKLRFVLVAVRCNSSSEDVIKHFLFREIWETLPCKDELTNEMAAQSGSSRGDDLASNGEVDVEWRAVARWCAQLAREIAHRGFAGRGGSG